MDRDGLLKSIANTGYNVGFGAKKHFATFDLVEKVPGWIGFASSAVGIFALVWEPLSAKVPSACLAVLGLCNVYIAAYRSKEYDEVGRRLTQIYNQLRDLERLTEPFDLVAGDEARSEAGEGLVDVAAPLVADWQAAEAVEPSVGALDDPAVTSEPLAAFDAFSGDARHDPTGPTLRRRGLAS